MDEQLEATTDNQATDSAPVAEQSSETGNEQQAPAVGEQTPTVKTEPLKPAFDYERAYKELHGGFTKATQRVSTIEKEFAKYREMIEAANYKPLSAEEIEKRVVGYDKQFSSLGEKLMAYEIKDALRDRRGDSELYPNFRQLEPVMKEIADSANCPIDINNQPIEVVLDALYKLAREQNSSAAVSQAKELGRKEAEVSLAKEAKSAVAGGGKSGNAPFNPKDASAEQMRKYFVEKGMSEF